jgi:glutamate-1-semialdehyde aminotransferase
MFISSTYWSDTIGLRAALVTLREIGLRRTPAHLKQLGIGLKRRLNAAAAQSGLNVVCQGIDVHPYLNFGVDDADVKSLLTTLYIQEMAKRGCHGYASFYLNGAQGEAEVDQTVAAAAEVFGLLKAGLDAGTLAELLECEPLRESFRRLVE